ncbi:MAG: Asp-tRNA(Asn)/Glu-tRNA(Gln) amidotransferase subunit GatC [Patescibacteria group bacterium]
MNKDEVLKLAKLVRIEMGDTEAENLTREFDAILGYVGEVKEVMNDGQNITAEANPIRNVMREDGYPHESGTYTEKILEQAPAREGDYIKVKKIL